MAASAQAAALGFNGAATIWSRKPEKPKPPAPESSDLQWGRDHLVAETWYLEVLWYAPAYRFNGAATIWSRKRIAPCVLTHRAAASMGPRPSGRGNLPSSRHGDKQMAMLQWGRDHLVAETCCCMSTSTRSVIRFNGAATIWSRKPMNELRTCWSWLRLQWGRDHLVAETGASRCRPPQRTRSFNGAATIWSRKPGPGLPSLPARSPSFNGAATIWSRKPDGCCPWVHTS